MKLFGREPSLVISVVASALSLLVGFGFNWLTAEQAALFVVVLNAVLGVVNAIAVRPIAPAAFTYLVGAVAALAAAYGLDVGQEMVGSINGLVLSMLMLLTRAQVTPAASPRPIDGSV
ncbi:hypothetical protein [Paractinoplanes maris]|uniref:hypothetical protein n=1 Tax=Paractinoplanes maris TaxID=1734446 RepID=UPI002021D515|nr:hypothetical protein [Actinoplanes maris]